MLKRLMPPVLTGVLLLASSAKADFLPENDLWKEDGLLRASGLSETDFNEVIDQLEGVYKDIFKSFGGRLKVNRLWKDPTVSASATQWGNVWSVNMYGGLARRPEVTRDALALVMCHEIGHHLAGYPFAGWRWASNEGQSDYFATLACSRLLWKGNDENASFARGLDSIPKARCDKAWDGGDERSLCYRQMAAIDSLGGLLSVISGGNSSWSSPDQSEVGKTYNGHPAAQCRLDTYSAGAVCQKDWDFTVIPAKNLGWTHNSQAGEEAALPYTCNQSEGLEYSFRPTCWFKPQLGGG